MQSAAIVYNPASRNAPSPERLNAAVATMALREWRIDLLPTEAAGHATHLARDAATRGVEIVFACGGDGTINEVSNGLVGSETALGVLRAGMGNVFAKEAGIPRRLEDALEQQLLGEDHHFDLGLAGNRYFLLMCGIGFDASVVQSVPPRQKRIMGSTSYALWGLKQALTYHSYRARFRLDQQEIEADLFWLLVSNTRSYGGVLNIASNALVDDGSLDSYYFAGEGLGWKAIVAARVALGAYRETESVVFQRIREAEVITPGLPVQADGEYFGETPIKIAVAPRALRVRLPAGKGTHLLTPDDQRQ